ncbi:hypothetical protein G6O69_24915 [Pseudenhygromyxa sp. WMMC2535]|uniref:hypothetical protein n=1 Tax=Pseudenhygromyxa sp. WMMC2535 TaxID=2712867 RepID=UPI001556FADB|nr:hypothetical protein [Pseudenhygromyxa sp. WMMC2535]NVB41105.1 hypothetical protein [Pseudenhygromyxa sp. WMMC2535]
MAGEADAIAKGAQVVITKGDDAGTCGEVFWTGKSKFGPGLRFGVKDEAGKIYWAGEGELEHASPAAPLSQTASPAQTPGPAPARERLIQFPADDGAFSDRIKVFEESVRLSNGVSVTELVRALGKAGAPVVEPLVARIEARTAALKATSRASGYKPRRRVLALRNALLAALGHAAAEQDAEIDPRFDAYLRPEPATLFVGSDDFPFSFLSALPEARELLERLPDARLRAIIAAWRGSAATFDIEKRLARALPPSRKKLLRGGPSLAEVVDSLAAQTGLVRGDVTYLLAPSRRKLSTLNRVGGRPKGLSKDRWPRDPDEDQPFSVALILDLSTIPELQSRYADARALVVLVDRPDEGFETAYVLPLTEAEAAAGVSGGRSFSVERVTVPAEVWATSEREGPLGTLRTRLAEAPGRALGWPWLLQSAPEASDAAGFVLQADERLVPKLNLGDAGRLFVYDGDAFWESH